MRASKMVWWGKVLVGGPDGLSLIPGLHKVSGENQPLGDVPWPSGGTCTPDAWLHIHK